MEARELPEPKPQPFELVLRIRHPSMDPADISSVLQIDAEHCFKAGEPRRPQNDTAPTARRMSASSSVHTETYWLATLNPGWWPTDLPFGVQASTYAATRSGEMMTSMARGMLARALILCIGRVLRPHAEFLRRIQSEGGEVRLLVEVNTAIVDGLTVPPELARELGAAGVPVDFEFSAS